MKRVVLGGGGHSHLEVVRSFGPRAPADTEILLADPEQFATYSGMLPGVVAGHYKVSECQVDLARLAQRAGALFVRRRIVAIDPARRRVSLDDGGAVDYDLLSLDIGSTTASESIDGAVQHAIAVKPFGTFAERWERALTSAASGALRRIVLVGGGAAGVELALAMRYRLAKLATEVTVVTADSGVVPDQNARARAAIERALARRKITVHVNAPVERIDATSLTCVGGLELPSDLTVIATGASAPLWLTATGLELDERGFVSVDAQLVSRSHPDVFAAGDCATISGRRYPKSGVYAVREGPIVAENLRRALCGEPLVHYDPQTKALALISAGEKFAIASYGRLAAAGGWVWRWKDYIDRKFVRRYQVS